MHSLPIYYTLVSICEAAKCQRDSSLCTETYITSASDHVNQRGRKDGQCAVMLRVALQLRSGMTISLFLKKTEIDILLRKSHLYGLRSLMNDQFTTIAHLLDPTLFSFSITISLMSFARKALRAMF